MLSFNTYISLSFLVPVLFVLDYAHVYREYFTIVVELTNSSLFRLLGVNAFIASTFLFWFVTCRAFFGRLNHTENELLRGSIPLHIAECVVGPLYFGVSLLGTCGVAALFTVVVALLHGVARERATTLHIVESPRERLLMLSGLTFFLFLAMPLDLCVVFDVFVNTARESDMDLTLKYSVAIMYLQFAISNLSLLVRLFFQEVIGEADHSALAFYAELFFSLIKSAVFIVSFTYVCFVSQPPFPLLRVLIGSAVDVVKRLQSLLTYLSLTRFVHSIKNATDEVLARDSCCAICQDDMRSEQNCKQLPCGHCYHEHCLRRWFEGMSTCPYCRADLMQHMRRSNTPVRFAHAPDHRRPAANNNDLPINDAVPPPAPPPPTTTTTNLRQGRDVVDDAPHNFAREAYQPPEEEEILRAYRLYRAKMTSTTVSEEERLNQFGGRLHGPANSRGIDIPRSESHAEATTCEPLVAAAGGASSACCTAESAKEGLVRETSTTGANAQVREREDQLLRAYMEYEETIRIASQTLQQRLSEIETTF
ncbi:E3 ubiquitin-protein ligase synoviolin [Trypanosoma rangeli]|uniref:E3 ubiquitin-protein ligase synoviolin n=1 Tax=Trypanosoma rangeli TaxID=5698 RepID=A0A3R7MBX1_TRYRA|nr:E3 ubiquitin-protein ligase synoviolin [Trypanosoma rangeli]RNF03022.1 E3 ubiquitin-protein ligase synoviolin [Trypanosoma rangeli]|eukprot:RNF03022.1 E3 ubiquitin-protein ligase synoviolin [Trypanosoma rangeli]